MKKTVLVLLAMVITGCAITQTATVPNGLVDFNQFKTVKLSIRDEVKTEYSKEGIEIFEVILKAKLRGIKYELVSEKEDLLIDIRIPYFKPENKALRILVGFGSGKGGLEYVADFKSKGNLLASLEGGHSYGDVLAMVPFGDMESSIYRGSDTNKDQVIMKSVNQIVAFIKSNGKKFQWSEGEKSDQREKP